MKGVRSVASALGPRLLLVGSIATWSALRRIRPLSVAAATQVTRRPSANLRTHYSGPFVCKFMLIYARVDSFHYERTNDFSLGEGAVKSGDLDDRVPPPKKK